MVFKARCHYFFSFIFLVLMIFYSNQKNAVINSGEARLGYDFEQNRDILVAELLRFGVVIERGTLLFVHSTMEGLSSAVAIAWSCQLVGSHW